MIDYCWMSYQVDSTQAYEQKLYWKHSKSSFNSIAISTRNHGKIAESTRTVFFKATYTRKSNDKLVIFPIYSDVSVAKVTV